MNNWNSLKPIEKRQAILDYLNPRHEGVVYAEIKAALGANDSLSTTLNTMLLRNEIGQKSRVGNVVKWIALVKESKPVRIGPEPAKVKESTKKKVNLTHYDGLMPYQIQPIVHTVKARPVFLMDRYGHSGGGQCAGRNFGSIQCNFSEKGLHI